jgi:hypothetical protein
MALMLGVALVIAGLLPVLYCLALFAWQFGALFQAGSWIALPATLLFNDHVALQGGKLAPVLPFIPHMAWPWLMSPESLLALHKLVASFLGRVHVGLVFGLAGLAVMALGALRARNSMSVIRAEKQRRADQLRRVNDYCLDASPARVFQERREPYIGASDVRRVA